MSTKFLLHQNLHKDISFCWMRCTSVSKQYSLNSGVHYGLHDPFCFPYDEEFCAGVIICWVPLEPIYFFHFLSRKRVLLSYITTNSRPKVAKDHNFSTIAALVTKGSMKTSTHLEYASITITNILFSFEPG